MRQERLTLVAELYGRPVLRFETGLGRSVETRGIEQTEDAWMLTGAWDRERRINASDIDRWLRGLRPQNGARSAQRRRAARRLEALKIERRYEDQGDIVWATPGYEYAGAVRFRSLREDDTEVEGVRSPMETLSETDLVRLLDQVVREMRRGVIEPGDTGIQPITSSGSLPKFAVHRSPIDGRWYLPAPGRLSTHIVKQEERGELPGEAAAESVCQRTLRHLGIRAARTYAGVIGGRQVIVSERGDRRLEPRPARIVPVHQEEWASACGLDPDEILQRPEGPGGWGDLRRFLGERGTATEGEVRRLWSGLAATALLGHRDLHRRNVGIRYSRAEEPPGCELAPWYDVSSCDGQSSDVWCAMGMLIGNRDDVKVIGEREWIRQARECGDDPGLVLGVVEDVAERLPEALDRATAEAREQDEWRDRAASERRIGALREGVAQRSEKARAPATNVARLRQEPPEWLYTVLEAMEANEEVELMASRQSSHLTIQVTGSDRRKRRVGEVENVSRYVEALQRAGAVDPDEVPFIERTLERARKAALARALVIQR